MRTKTSWTLAGFLALLVGGAWAVPASGVATTATGCLSRDDRAGAFPLDPPAAPSHCRKGHFRVVGTEGGTFYFVSWRDNSSDEDGFTMEVWRRNESGVWVLDRSVDMPANSTGFGLAARPGPNDKFRVRAFNASGDSAWSNWAH
jgi:hypothetical protein